MQTEEKRTVFDIVEAIARSRKAVQESIDLTRRNTKRKEALVQKPQSLPQSFSTPPSTSVDTLLNDLNMKLQNEVYLRSTYEQAVSHLRGRVQELESLSTQRAEYEDEIAVLKTELQQEQLWKLRFSDLEHDLTSRVSAQTEHIQTLEEEIQIKDRLISSVSQNALSRDQLIHENLLLQASIQSLGERYAEALRRRDQSQTEPNLNQELPLVRHIPNSPESDSPIAPKTDEDQSSPIDTGLEQGQVSPEKERGEIAQIHESESRIAELERRLEISTLRYEELKRRMSPSLSDVSAVHRKAKTVAESPALDTREPHSVRDRPPKHKTKARIIASHIHRKPSPGAGKGKKPSFT